jgi:hypothetical protein
MAKTTSPAGRTNTYSLVRPTRRDSQRRAAAIKRQRKQLSRLPLDVVTAAALEREERDLVAVRHA